MTATSALFLILLLWAAIGVSAAIVMGRRGHAPAVWALLGAVLGPLVIPLMIVAARGEPSTPSVPVTTPPTSGDRLDVVVGVDGSSEAKAALDLVTSRFGGVIGRLAVVTVVNYELGPPGQPTPAQREAEAMLAEHARAVTEKLGREPECTVLTGRPADALAEFTRINGFDLLVVGPRGRGASRLVLGSVATALARGVDVPVVIVPPTAAISTGNAQPE